MRQLKTFTLKLKGDTDYPGLIEIKAENLIDIADLDVDVAKAKLEVLCRSKGYNGVIDAVLFSRFEPAAKQVMIHIAGRPVVFSALTAKDRVVAGGNATIRLLSSRVFRRDVVFIVLSILLVFFLILGVQKYNHVIEDKASAIYFDCLVENGLLDKEQAKPDSFYGGLITQMEIEDSAERDNRVATVVNNCKSKSARFYKSRSLFD